MREVQRRVVETHGVVLHPETRLVGFDDSGDPMTAASLFIDPRLRARRLAVLREEGRRRLRIVAIALALVGAVAGAWGITRSPLLDVDLIKINGLEDELHYEVWAALEIEPGVALFDVDTGEAAEAITALPWVKETEVRRDCPAPFTLMLSLVKRLRWFQPGVAVLLWLTPADTSSVAS